MKQGDPGEVGRIEVDGANGSATTPATLTMDKPPGQYAADKGPAGPADGLNGLSDVPDSWTDNEQDLSKRFIR